MNPLQIVVMGVSGSGKSTIAGMLADALGWPFAEGDDFHPEANVRKMSDGRPLTDEDRRPWLLAIRAWMTRQEMSGREGVVSCSALKRGYRDMLRQGPGRVTFVLLDVSRAALEVRVAHRPEHFMPATLLDSQLRTLERLEPDEHGITVDGDLAPAEIVADILRELHLPSLPSGAGEG